MRQRLFLIPGLPLIAAFFAACAGDPPSDLDVGAVQYAVQDGSRAGCADPVRFCSTADPNLCLFGCASMTVPSRQCVRLLEVTSANSPATSLVCTSAPDVVPGPPPSACSAEACGPAPGIPSYTCSDGSAAGRGDCERNAQGQCAWVIRSCPEDGEITPDGMGSACALFLEDSDDICGRHEADACRFQDPDCGVAPPSSWCPVSIELPRDGVCTSSDEACTSDPDCPEQCEEIGGVRQPDGTCLLEVPDGSGNLCPGLNGDGVCDLASDEPCFVKDTDCVCAVSYLLPLDGVCSGTDACTTDPDCRPAPTPLPVPPPACDGGVCSAQGGSCANGETCCAGLECCSGIPVSPGQEFCGSVCPKSDRNLKQEIESIDPATILELVTRLPISVWSYKSEPARRHIGPMAQDFMATFGVGSSDQTILQVDGDGVALASIQALSIRLERLENDNRALRDALARFTAAPAVSSASARSALVQAGER